MIDVEGKRYATTRDACDWLCGHWEGGQPGQLKLCEFRRGGGANNITSVGGAESGHAAARERKAVASGSQFWLGKDAFWFSIMMADSKARTFNRRLGNAL